MQTEPPPAAPPLLECVGVSLRFFGVHALEQVSWRVAAGEIHALCGANGAGKSTLMKILVGVHQPDEGRVLLEGRPVRLSGPEAARAQGIEIVFQEIELPPNLTVAEAVFLGREPRRGPLLDHPRMLRDTAALLARLALQGETTLAPTAPVETLSVAEKQLVQIARALTGRARLLILDEPTSALSDHEVERLFRILLELRAAGTTILYVSHKLDEIFRLADRVTTLRDGRLVDTVPIAELTRDSLVARMAGRAVDGAATRAEPAAEPPVRAPVLQVRNLTRAGAFRNVSFSLHAGEVLGMFGIVGAGRTEVARCLFGLDRPDAGEMLLHGRPTHFSSPAAAVSAGMALVPEDRKGQGLLLGESILRNISLPSLPRLTRWGVVQAAAERALALEAMRRLHVVATGPDQEVRQLSGGNQQKVVLGRWSAARPTVLLLDEPTRGIDVSAKSEVHELIRGLAAEGLAVLLISSELDEVLGLADRLLVLRAGRVVGEMSAAGASRTDVLRLAVS